MTSAWRYDAAAGLETFQNASMCLISEFVLLSVLNLGPSDA